MRNKVVVALALVASLLLAVPAVSASEVADPVLAKLEAILTTLAGVRDQSDALTKKVEALEKQVAEIHKAILPTDEAKPETLIIRNDGTTPISVAESDEWGKFELLELKEKGSDVVARIRLRTAADQDANYTFYLESGKGRFEPDIKYSYVPSATTREYTVTYKKAAGSLTSDGYISVEVANIGWREVARIYLAPNK